MIAVAHSATHPPIQPASSPARLRKAPIAPFLAYLPNENSTIIRGTDQRKRNRIQAIRKLPPPLLATIRGNRQMLPVPTAIPSVATTRPQRLWKRSVKTLPRVGSQPLAGGLIEYGKRKRQ